MKTHPFFPRYNAEDSENEGKGELRWIFVTRLNRDTGKYDWCHERHEARELTGLDQIAGRFGGGTYKMVGRNEEHICCQSEDFTISDLPERPLNHAPKAAPDPDNVVPLRPMGAMPSVQMPAPTNTSEAMMMGMFQFMAMSMQQSTQLVLGLLQNQTQASERAANEARAMYQQTLQQMATLHQTAVHTPAANADLADKQRIDWMEFGAKMADAARGDGAGGKPGPSWQETMQTMKEGLASVAEIARAVTTATGPGGAAPGTAPAVESAAAAAAANGGAT